MIAHLVFNGHTIESIRELDEDIFHTMMIMYADGILGNLGMMNVMGSLTNAVFNYMRSKNTSPYSLKSILNKSYGYIYDDVELSVSDSLKLFMSQAQGFNMDYFNKA